MFRFAKDGCVRWPVTLQQMQDDGSAAEQSFIVTYERLTRSEKKQRDADVLEFTQQFRAALPEDGAADTAELTAARASLSDSRMAADDELLRSRVKGWANIADQDGNALPFSTAALDAFINDELLRTTLLRGLLDVSAGVQSKNLLPGLAGLPVPAQA
jgi:hypothetical protein